MVSQSCFSVGHSTFLHRHTWHAPKIIFTIRIQAALVSYISVFLNSKVQNRHPTSSLTFTLSSSLLLIYTSSLNPSLRFRHFQHTLRIAVRIRVRASDVSCTYYLVIKFNSFYILTSEKNPLCQNSYN